MLTLLENLSMKNGMGQASLVSPIRKFTNAGRFSQTWTSRLVLKLLKQRGHFVVESLSASFVAFGLGTTGTKFSVSAKSEFSSYLSSTGFAALRGE